MHWAQVPGARSAHAFLWHADTGIVDVHPLGADFSSVYDINDHGQIVGATTVAPSGAGACVWSAKDGMRSLE